MQIYSKVLFAIGVLNIITSSVFTIYYYIKPGAFAEGTTTNTIAFLIGIFGSFVMMILVAFYYLGLRCKKMEMTDLVTFNAFNVPFYIVFSLNWICRHFFAKGLNVLGSSTPAKVTAFLASSMLLNITIVTITLNYIKRN